MECLKKLVILSVILGVVVAEHNNTSEIQPKGLDLSYEPNHHYDVESSLFSGLVYKSAHTLWKVLSVVWAVAGFKLAALAIAAKAIVWVIRNGFSFILGAVVMFGFCKFTGKCNFELAHYPHSYQYVGVHREDLNRVQRSLDKGFDLYGMFGNEE